ncbi:MAG: translation initiation factor IF-2 N-terminal domain-containing protein, partial [Acidimicrobiales bacterium]
MFFVARRRLWARVGGCGSQLAKKIRVYELAKELGLENKEALDYCIAMGIGVKS